MLKREHNELLTRTDAGTPMGRMFRCYWLPAMLASELPEDGCPPVRIRLLGERLLAIRDGNGEYGLIDELCAHRRVSLWFGMMEPDGVRCAYHGWKYDVEGRCTDIPSEPADSELCRRVRLKNYPLVRIGDVLWTYMGPPDERPPLPEWEFATVPAEQTFTSKRLQECNWLQAMEGGIDSSHVSWLHRGNLNSDPLFKGAKANQYNLNDARPVFEVSETDGGLAIGARRLAENDQWYWRITPWVMPSFTMVPPRADHPLHGHFWIPIDDETCWAWSFDYHPSRALFATERQAMEDGKGIHVKVDVNFRPLANKDNDYLIDREAQRAGRTFSGVEGIGMQDASLQESMGPICDRTQEHLVSTDRGIVMARSRLLRAVRALNEQGTRPPGLDPAHQRIRSTAMLLPAEQPFDEPARTAMVAAKGKAHVTV